MAGVALDMEQTKQSVKKSKKIIILLLVLINDCICS